VPQKLGDLPAVVCPNVSENGKTGSTFVHQANLGMPINGYWV